MSFRDHLLEAPAPGQTIMVGAFEVECRVCRCCAEPTPRFFVRNPAGDVVSMGTSFRRMMHFRGWQLDPMTALRRDGDGNPVVMEEPPGWPIERMNAWQRMCWYLARNDMLLGDTAEPITRVHPDCAGPKPDPTKRRPSRRDASPPPEPELPPLPRGDADDDGQFSLWSST